MTPVSAIDAAAGRILIAPIRHVYALLWRIGIIDVESDRDSVLRESD